MFYKILKSAKVIEYGQDVAGPYRDYMGGSLVLDHMGGTGFVSIREPQETDEPLKQPAQLLMYQAGVCSTDVTLGAYYHALRTGEGTQNDVFIQESVIQNLPVTLIFIDFLGITCKIVYASMAGQCIWHRGRAFGPDSQGKNRQGRVHQSFRGGRCCVNHPGNHQRRYHEPKHPQAHRQPGRNDGATWRVPLQGLRRLDCHRGGQ